MTKLTEKEDKWIAEQSLRGRILERSISKRSKFRKFLEENSFTEDELNEIFIAFSLAAATDRKLVANTFTVGITLRTKAREIEQMLREINRRYETRTNYSIRQRAFFESCLTRGWGSKKENWAIASEIVASLRAIGSDPLSDAPYKSAGINIASLISSINKNKLKWRYTINDAKKNSKQDETVNSMLEGVVRSAEFKIHGVSKLVYTIQKGGQRAYIPYEKEKKAIDKTN